MKINEDFLHYLWKHKYLTLNQLQTTEGSEVTILNPGEHNLNSGPDFFNAKLIIGGQTWAGNIEIHLRSSDWYIHHHEEDTSYDNVILHVVWQHDAEVYRASNDRIPALEIKNYVDDQLLNNYRNLFLKPVSFISCENEIGNIDYFTLDNWLERLYVERLCKRSELISELLKNSENDWEAVLFQLLCKNFGLKVNGEAFLSLGRSFDFSVLRFQQQDLGKLEALLFGQAGFLEKKAEDKYFNDLKREYDFLKRKYHLHHVENKQFLFFRLRPVNFPTIRIAQLARLYFTHKNLFSKILEVEKIEDFYHLFSVEASFFWQEHYSFNSPSKKNIKKVSRSFIDLLLINTVFPLIFQYHKEQGKLDSNRILQFIQELKPEKNSITDNFSTLGVVAGNALRTQAFLQLKHEYCDKHLCLECAVGNKILRSKKKKP